MQNIIYLEVIYIAVTKMRHAILWLVLFAVVACSCIAESYIDPNSAVGTEESAMSDEAAAGVVIAMIIMFAIFGLFSLVGIACMVFWVWMLVDCSRRDYAGEHDKLMWILIIALGGGIGAAIYFFVVKIKDQKGKLAGSKGR